MARCMMPGCTNQTDLYDVLCPECRRQSNNSRVAVDMVDLDSPCHGYHVPALEEMGAELLPDMTALVGHLVLDKQEREQVIHLQQRKLDLRGKLIRKLTSQRDAEKARADGLAEQNAGLQAALGAAVEQLARLKYLHTGARVNGFAAVETAVGDWRPFDDAGYDLLYERIDPVTNRAVAWVWFRAENRSV